jgi:pimeloyl-ACP methyl ester carboxylesterase
VTPRYLSDQLAEGVAGAEKVMLPTGGHFVLHVLVDEYNAAVADFIKRHPIA